MFGSSPIASGGIDAPPAASRRLSLLPIPPRRALALLGHRVGFLDLHPRMAEARVVSRSETLRHDACACGGPRCGPCRLRRESCGDVVASPRAYLDSSASRAGWDGISRETRPAGGAAIWLFTGSAYKSAYRAVRPRSAYRAHMSAVAGLARGVRDRRRCRRLPACAGLRPYPPVISRSRMSR
jgi:hypothetical protein